LLVVGAILAFLLLGSPSEPAPTLAPTAEPVPTDTAEPVLTDMAEPVTEDAWPRIQAAGKMVVGTAADYPPFAYYNGGFQLDGFDIALMREIGQRLGVDVEIKDMAFDGLGGALLLNQIDVAIAALSVTPERDAWPMGEHRLAFRRDWALPSCPTVARLRVSAFAAYGLWLNGRIGGSLVVR